ncbi:hypothetical protein HPP92_022476 [Vanilla planifolia]|uniref:Endonuclease/exonuclease/phosphatase domain-containing protein n=1 Tax=Vanilla planifolia TaxID=51239 RepID=A0A835PYB6_VANPL|nr:hypothetical protein HPP92_022476 [Vanilla planifolia]
MVVLLRTLVLPALSLRRICSIKMGGTTEPSIPNFVSLGVDNSRKISSGFKFSLVSYNILAQVYVKSIFFPHSPSSCLKWKARSEAVLTDLKSLNADFFCIQELDEYENFYKGNIEKHGYSSIYIQRPGQKRDGCGIFYKQTSAELVQSEEIHYNDLVDSVAYSGDSNGIERTSGILAKEVEASNDTQNKNGEDNDGNLDDLRLRLKRDCVGLLAAFKLKDPSKHVLIVANTHIYWDPAWVDVKVAQVKYLLSRLSIFEEVIRDKYSCKPSVVIAGDFNSTPGDEVYKYITSAAADYDGPSPPMQLHSLYGAHGGEPPFTNCTPEFTGTLDYIFLSDACWLKPVSLLRLPGPDSVDVVGGLPNHHHPSDHLPIGGEFEVFTIS